MAKYRKKPVVIEAWRWTGEVTEELKDIVTKPPFVFSYESKSLNCNEVVLKLTVETLEGTMIISAGDYIIRGVNGEYYPCKPYIFEKTYEIVEK